MVAAFQRTRTDLPRANVRGGVNPFPASQYVCVRRIPIFAEHETTDPDGKKQVFDTKALQFLTDRGNARVRNTGDYTAVTVGHTHDPEDHLPQPETIGYMGNYQLGRLGAKKVILADLWIRRDKIHLYNSMPRRSVELWYENGKPSYIDPLCLLSETPRLDLGLSPHINPNEATGNKEMRFLYAASYGKRRVMKYAASFAAGSALNVAPLAAAKTTLAKKQVKEPYQNQTSTKGRSMSLNLSPEALQQIVDALQKLDFVAVIRDAMPALSVIRDNLPQLKKLLASDIAEQALPDVQEPSESLPVEELPPGYADEEATLYNDDANEPEPGREPDEVVIPNLDDEGDEEPEPKRYAKAEAGLEDVEAMSDEDYEKYQAACTECRKKRNYAKEDDDTVIVNEGGVPDTSTAAKYSAAKYSAIHAQNEKLKKQVSESTDARRRAELQCLRMQRTFDVNAEMKRCCYSKMNDADFELHKKSIRDNYVHTPLGTQLPVHDDPEPTVKATPKKAAYSKAVVDKAVKYTTQTGGKKLSYEQALEAFGRGETPT